MALGLEGKEKDKLLLSLKFPCLFLDFVPKAFLVKVKNNNE